MPKYVVPGIPAGAQLSAFMPRWTRAAASGAVQYKQAVSGQPGTQGIPAPTVNTQIAHGNSTIAMMGGARSSDAPDMWYPQQYYQRFLTEHPPVRVYSDNMLPVPAKDSRGLPAMLSKRIRQRGQQQIGQPRVVPRWGNGG